MAFTGNYTCDSFKQQLFQGVFNFNTGTPQVFKIALYTNNATFDASTTTYTATDEASATGYTAGGAIITPSLSLDTSSGVAYLNFSNASWTAAITARGALIYKVDPTGPPINPTICILDFGSDKISTTTFQVAFPANTSTAALIRLA
jgi:hypothetical protein